MEFMSTLVKTTKHDVGNFILAISMRLELLEMDGRLSAEDKKLLEEATSALKKIEDKLSFLKMYCDSNPESLLLFLNTIKNDIEKDADVVDRIINSLILNGKDRLSQGDVKYLKESLSLLEEIRKKMDFLIFYSREGKNSWISAKDIWSACVFSEKINVVSDEGLDNLFVFSSSLIPNVLQNLIDNTFRHSGGATIIEFSYYFKGDILVFVVQDNGVGVSPQDKGKIFDEGFGSNTGMGLYLVKVILGFTGMKISETGTFGEGARFEVEVPPSNYIFSI
ncbi:MAG: sensor histidine kinase [Minisyncoccales bacterium]